MSVNNAYRLCLAVFKQSATGNVYGKLPAGEYAGLKWDMTSSIIPAGYEFTNFQLGDTTVETIEKNTITALSKNKEFESGAVTPPTLTFANMTSADEANIISQLDKLTNVDDPFKVLFTAGVFTSEASGKRNYNIFNACVAIVTSDGGRTGEAKAKFTGSLAMQACHLPLIGTADCAAALEWTVSTGAVAMTVNSGSGGSGSGGSGSGQGS